MKPGEANIPPDLSPNDDIERATTIGRRILDDADGYDVVLLNELFTDDGQVAMRDTLKATFPYYVITTNNGPVTTNNAGLAVFSRFAFEKLTAPYQGSKIEAYANAPGDAVNSEGRHSHFAFAEFDDSCAPDTWANKGALLVRVVTPKGSKRYNVMATHTQSDDTFLSTCGLPDVQAVRTKQFEQMAQLLKDSGAETKVGIYEQTLIGGDLNVQGWLPRFSSTGNLNVLPSTMLAAEYGKSLWGGGAFLGIPMYDPWRLTSNTDDGATYLYNEVPQVLQRLDYILFNGGSAFQPGGDARVPLTEKNSCPQWARRAMTDIDSDHFGVALEVGPGSAQCAPWNASAPSDPIRLTFAEGGADHWVYVANPGTYSVGLPDSVVAAGVRADVLLARNMGVRASQSRMLKERRMPVEKELGTYKPYGISEPVYIRVHAPKADVTGSFVVSVVKHTCATPDDACELVAPGATRTGAPFHIQWPEHRVPVGLNNVRRGYFVHSNTPMARGVADLAFNLIAPSATARAKVVVTSQQGQNRTVEIVGSGKLPFTTTTAADGYSIIVEELAGTSPSSFGIWYDTNATMVASFLGTSSKVRVYVGNETGIGAGSDEARCWLRPESLDFADIGTQYEDELDTGRSLFIDAKRLAFRTQLSASCKEFVGGDGGGLDNSDGVSVPALPFGTASRLYQKARLKMGESGDYELQYSLVKRLP